MDINRRFFSKIVVQLEKAYHYCLVASFLLIASIFMLMPLQSSTNVQHHPEQSSNRYTQQSQFAMEDGWIYKAPESSYRTSVKPFTRFTKTISANPDQETSGAANETSPALLDNIRQPCGGIAHEYILHFNNLAGLRAFLEKARERGLEILGFSEKLLSIRFHAESLEAYGDLFNDISSANLEQNGEVFTPGLFNLSPPPILAGYEGFGRGALSWLGLTERPANWGSGVVVAILDTTIEPHPALGSAKIRYFDLLEGDKTTTTGEYAGHGTAVASIIAGNDGLVQGIAPLSELLAISVLGGNGLGDTFTLAEGILTAVDNGANLINMSLGSYADSATLRQAINYALDKGVVIVASSGNDGLGQVMYPAAYDGVISVGAVDALEQHLSFSNFGKVDISAPGYKVQTAWANGLYAGFSGTSAAAPFVAGTIAGLASENRDLSVRQAADIVLTETNDTGAPGQDDLFGSGILNVERIQSRNSSGIYDLAVAGYYLPTPETPTEKEAMPLVVTIENRGTEDIGQAEVEININGKTENHTLTNLLAGTSIGIDAEVSKNAIGADGVVKVSATGRITGEPDQNKTNNIRIENLIFTALNPSATK